MTPSQLLTLKNHINSTFASEWAAKQVGTIVDAYNAQAAPSFVVWRTAVTTEEMHTAYVWTELDALPQSKFNQLSLLLSLGAVNPSKPNVRQGLSDIFAGASFDGTRAALIALAKRPATLAEKVFATGTGTNGSPALLGWEGVVTAFDVYAAMGS